MKIEVLLVEAAVEDQVMQVLQEQKEHSKKLIILKQTQRFKNIQNSFLKNQSSL